MLTVSEGNAYNYLGKFDLDQVFNGSLRLNSRGYNGNLALKITERLSFALF